MSGTEHSAGRGAAVGQAVEHHDLSLRVEAVSHGGALGAIGSLALAWHASQATADVPQARESGFAESVQPGTLRSSSSSQGWAEESLGARQSPRGDKDPPEPTLGPFGMAERLN